MRFERSEDGAATVEFALILPLVLIFFCGVIDLGLAYSVKSTLTHAAREGVRTWVTTEDSTKARTAALAAADVGIIDGADVAVDTPATPCNEGDPTQVTVRYEYSFITPIAELAALIPGDVGPVDTTINLTSIGVMACGS